MVHSIVLNESVVTLDGAYGVCRVETREANSVEGVVVYPCS